MYARNQEATGAWQQCLSVFYDSGSNQLSDYLYCQEYHVSDRNISICGYSTTPCFIPYLYKKTFIVLHGEVAFLLMQNFTLLPFEGHSDMHLQKHYPTLQQACHS